MTYINISTSMVIDILRESEEALLKDYPEVKIRLDVLDPLPDNPDHPFLYVSYNTEDGDYEHEFSVNSVGEGDRLLNEEDSSIQFLDTSGEEVILVVDLEDVVW